MLQPPARVVVPCALFVIAGGVALAVSGSIAAVDQLPENRGQLLVAAIPPLPAPPAPEATPAEPPEEPAPNQLDPAQFSFVMRVAGASYFRLSDDAVSPHAADRLVAEDGIETSIAPLRATEVPDALRGWDGREVIVDGTCRAHVVGFARIARLTGDPGYAGDDHPKWTAASVVEHGSPMIAAKLDRCSGIWLRAASLAPVGLAEPIRAPELVAAARVDLFAGELANQIQASWHAEGIAGDWRTEVPITAIVARHSITGERWVVLHAFRNGGCGDHEVNILAVYRANDDGTVTRISARTVGVDSIERLVDLDGDGRFEVIATEGWGLDRTFIDLHGTPLSTLPLQFYGCPC